MKLLKTMLWATIGTVAMGGAGLVIRTIRHCRDKIAEREFEQQELAVLEGEGGICLG
jgi:hypothetical protein